ncbi:hypothetical protein [Adhaeretor mobilis]|uniref:Uncharacterized protein n=1 Tax=Adhaeretor mobilis TaxID=1930276 RepID=A0A517MVK9_9BACT|nr:hypothetical protein [Adhaeretor mobilis]QDS98916.1 hypothetical protein HG15A2_22040 [Adhaeretor mobilis]
MNLSSGTLHTIRWNELCPWLILARATRVALMVRVLLLALVGVLLTQAGWRLLEYLFLGTNGWFMGELSDAPMPGNEDFLSTKNLGPLIQGWQWAIRPLLRLGEATTLNLALGYSVLGLWTMVTWSLFGGAIARIAALYLTREETLGPFAALRAAASHWTSTFGAPAVTFVGLVVMALPLVLIGLITRLELGAALTGLLMIVPLLMGLGFAIAAIGLLLGWPLMWSTVAVERSDAFDAVSRSYSYVFQRPLHLLFYIAFATILGILAQWLLFAILNFGSESCYHLLGLSGGEQVLEQWLLVEAGSGSWFNEVRLFWERSFMGIAKSFPMAFLFPTAVAIYLLLRREIDAAEMDQVTLDDPAKVSTE